MQIKFKASYIGYAVLLHTFKTLYPILCMGKKAKKSVWNCNGEFKAWKRSQEQWSAGLSRLNREKKTDRQIKK